MNILYLSSMYDDNIYNYIFDKFGRISSYASQKYNRMMVVGLEANGHKVSVLSQIVLPEKGEFDATYVASADGYVYIMPGSVRSKISAAYAKIVAWAKEHPDGIVVCDIVLGELSLALTLAKPRIKCKSVALVTDVPACRANPPKSFFRKCTSALKNKLITGYDAYILLTEQMNELVNPKRRPYVVVEGFVDRDMEKIENVLEGKHNKKVCMFAGLLDRVYGIETLVQAFISADVENSELHIYGHGDYLEELKNVCEKHNNVKYMGELPNDEIIKEELRATLMINPRPSDAEYTKYSFPSKNMEYIVSGTPMLTTKLKCMPPEYYEHIYITEDETVEGWTKTIKCLLSNEKEKLHKKGRSAKEWILADKNNVIMTKKITELLRSLQK